MSEGMSVQEALVYTAVIQLENTLDYLRMLTGLSTGDIVRAADIHADEELARQLVWESQKKKLGKF